LRYYSLKLDKWARVIEGNEWDGGLQTESIVVGVGSQVETSDRGSFVEPFARDVAHVYSSSPASSSSDTALAFFAGFFLGAAGFFSALGLPLFGFSSASPHIAATLLKASL